MGQVSRESTASLHDSLHQSEEIQALRTETLAIRCGQALTTLQAIEDALRRSEANVDTRIRQILETTQAVREIGMTLVVAQLCWEWLLGRWVEGGGEV